MLSLVKSTPKDEQETTINIDYEGNISIYTNIKKLVNKLEKYVNDYPDIWRYEIANYYEGIPTGYFFYTNQDLISIRSHKIKLSDQAKDKRKFNMEKIRQFKQKS